MLNLNIIFLLNLLNSHNFTKTSYDIENTSYKAPMKEASNNNYLTSVKFKDISFVFNKDITRYTIEVPYSKDKLELTYLQEDNNSIVEIAGDEDLKIGNNSLAILVTAQDGTIREYDFTIIRTEDNTIVQSNLDSIKNILSGSDSAKLTVNMSSDLILDQKAAEALKENKKTLVFKWADYNNKFISSLTVDGSKINNTKEINPKIKNTITNNKLKNHLKDTEYTSISTQDTNIPNNSLYKLTVSGNDDVYYVYYYEDDLLMEKPIRVIDNTIEFEVKDGIDYAITTKSNRPTSSKTVIDNLYWLWISLFITVLFIVFFSITKYTALKYVQHSHHNDRKVDDDTLE